MNWIFQTSWPRCVPHARCVSVHSIASLPRPDGAEWPRHPPEMSAGSAPLGISLCRPCWSRWVDLKIQRGQFLTRNLGFCDLDPPIRRCPIAPASRRAEGPVVNCPLPALSSGWGTRGGSQQCPAAAKRCKLPISYILLD